MKKLFLLFLISATAHGQTTEEMAKPIPHRTIDNLPTLDVYGIVPRELNGGGAGFGVFSPAIPLPPSLLPGAELRLGGDLYFSGMDRRTMRNVPLQAPQAGEAKVKLRETLFGFNGVARLSLPWDDMVSPYIDGFVGLRAITTDITVTPNNYQPGYEKSTSENLDAAFALNYGATAGVLVSLGPNVKLNAGVMFSRSHKPGSIGNIHSAGLEPAGLVMDKKPLARDMVMFKLGVTFKIDPTSSEPNSDCNCCTERRSSRIGGFSRRSTPAPNKVGIRTKVPF